MRVDKTI